MSQRNIPVLGAKRLDLGPQSWMKAGLCYDTAAPDAWFDGGADTHIGWARELCEGCPVVAECLAYALDNGERYGVWGSTTWPERKQMLRKRARAAR